MRLQMFDRDYYTVAALGKSREITPEGFLLCRGVAIARIGLQTYDRADLPLETGPHGKIIAERLPEEVFRRETIASFEGKPVTVNHPDGEFVSPANWKRYSVGIVQNVRRGEGPESDLLLADLLITSADAIAYANTEFPEISAGYECEYERVGRGKYIQRNIIGNHVALVRRGRAGPRCAIKDAIKEPPVKKSRLAKLLAAFGVENAETVADAMEEIQVTGQPTTDSKDDAVKVLDERLSKIETGFAELKALLTKDADAKKKDDDQSATAGASSEAEKPPMYTADAAREIVARAEILAPGITFPTTDALSLSDAERLMSEALQKAQATEAGAECIKPFLMGRDLKVLTGDALVGVFNGAAELMRVRNNQRAIRQPAATKDSKPLTIAEINARNAEFWASRT